MSSRPTVAFVTLGCARNEVDSEELAGRLAADGWDVVEEPDAADAVLVNTCGFVAAAKKDSVDTILSAADLKDSGATQAVVAVGCLAERYGTELAAALPEADAVLGFDAYADISAQLRSVVAGETIESHTPRDRRALLPISPVERRSAPPIAVPGHGADLADNSGIAGAPQLLRRRLVGGPVAPLKLASGCDRRCSFCAIPAFRGSYVSRPVADVLAEARWLAADGVRELVLVSENSTSYGKDLGDVRLLESLLPELAAVDGVDRVRVSYLQPAEMRPSLVEVIATTPGIAPYFDLSFQHASGPLLRRMRRFGDRERFLELLEQVRAAAPEAGVRSNVILGFPGETEDDLAELTAFISAARLDAIGVFGYSDEDGTEAEGLPDKVEEHVVAERVAELSGLADELTTQRAEDRVGDVVTVLVEDLGEGGTIEGRAEHQGPEVDGSITVRGAHGADIGQFVRAVVVGSDGVDLVAEVSPRERA